MAAPASVSSSRVLVAEESSVQSPSGGSRRTLWILGAVAVVLIIAAGWWFSRPSSPGSDGTSDRPETEETTPAIDINEADEAEPTASEPVEPDPPLPPKTPFDLLTELATPTERGHLELLRSAMTSSARFAPEEEQLWRVLLRNVNLREPLARWLEEWFDAPEWTRRWAAATVDPLVRIGTARNAARRGVRAVRAHSDHDEDHDRPHR